MVRKYKQLGEATHARYVRVSQYSKYVLITEEYFSKVQQFALHPPGEPCPNKSLTCRVSFPLDSEVDSTYVVKFAKENNVGFAKETVLQLCASWKCTTTNENTINHFCMCELRSKEGEACFIDTLVPYSKS